MTTIEAPKTTPKEVTTADVLERVMARAEYLIEEFGWGQRGDLDHTNGPICVGLALGRAANDVGVSWGWFGSAEYTALGFPFNDELVPWNDTPGRTKSEVVSLLRQAAECSRETA